ncbi:DUF1080 domain-containing protein [Mucilaginibacter sp.]|uniref:3-keto-disaccharide hydrolase n=1 Tax=Mucilaginibacter sp. TaxID=1882438 RepID=UPI0035616C45
MKTKNRRVVMAATVLALIINCYAIVGNKNNELTPAEKKAGWKLLFDGHSTAGWHLYNSKGPFTFWKAGNGELFCDPKDKSGVGDLVSDNEYKNFDLKFDWKLPKGGNSGVFINVLERKDIPTAWASGPEYQLLDKSHLDYPQPKSRSGCLYGFSPQKNPVKNKPTGEWNHAEIRQMDGKIEFFLNGVLTCSEDLKSDAWKKAVAASHFKSFPEFGKHFSGRISLQDWSTGISFRNIKIKEL